MGISVIIPTFNNVDYLEECIKSVYDSGLDREYELLLGIDGCEKTLEYIKNIEINNKTKVFYFPENGGPYIIKNTLAKIANFDKLLFFDSDDVMELIMITICDEGLQKYQIVRPRYLNFKIVNEEKVITNVVGRWGEGVFAIKKEIFLGLNGFEGWRVAADSDFLGRLIRNRARFWNTNQVLFHRRVHPNSLTMSKETGFTSEIRNNYAKISMERTNFGPLPFLSTGEYNELVFNKTEPLDLKTFLSEKNENFDDKKYKEKKKLISKILNSQEIKPTLTQSNKLNYDDINRNNVTKNNKSKINSAINRVQNLSNDTKKHFGKKNIK